MEKYLTPNDPNAFLGHTKREQPKGFLYECPHCKGYGEWNLQLNQYPQNDPPRCHFRASCDNCNGIGYVNDASHIHDWEFTRNISRCYNEYQCTICKRIKTIDSSG